MLKKYLSFQKGWVWYSGTVVPPSATITEVMNLVGNFIVPQELRTKKRERDRIVERGRSVRMGKKYSFCTYILLPIRLHDRSNSTHLLQCNPKAAQLLFFMFLFFFFTCKPFFLPTPLSLYLFHILLSFSYGFVFIYFFFSIYFLSLFFLFLSTYTYVQHYLGFFLVYFICSFLSFLVYFDCFILFLVYFIAFLLFLVY